MEVLKQVSHKARKRHVCEGRIQIQSYDSLFEYQEQGGTCDGQIKTGSTYTLQSILNDGSVSDWRSCPECHHYITENKLYDL